MTKPPAATQSKWRLGAISLLLIAIAIALGVLWFSGAFSWLSATMHGWVQAAGPWGGLVIIGLMIAHSVLFFPLELLAIVAGATFGFWWGSLYIWIGAMLAAALCFALARKLGRPFVERILPEKSRLSLDKWTRQNSATALLISRFLPIVSFNLVNYGAGLTPVPWRTFLWTTAVGIIPIMALSVWFGSAMMALPLSTVIVMSALFIIAILAVHWAAHKWGWATR